MLSFACEFPVSETASRQRLCATIREWIIGSRYTMFSPDDLADLGKGESWTVIAEQESIETLAEITSDIESIAVMYRKQDANFEWITTVVLAAQPSSSWVSVRVECVPQHPMAQVPAAKKPVLVKLLLKELGGGVDGGFMVTSAPVILAQSEINVAAQCIQGKAESYLPIVYVSAAFNGSYLVDPNELATVLAGMAHVVVEPTRSFSIRLMDVVQRKNPYGGNIALYWPEGGGRRSFFVRDGLDTPLEMCDAILTEIRLSLIHRRPLTRCTVAALRELRSRRQINALKDSGSAEVDQYVEAFEDELLSKNMALEAAESEINRLKAEVRRYESQAIGGGELHLSTGDEDDFYDGEILSIVMDAIDRERSKVVNDSRAQHVLAALLVANPISEERLRHREKIKALLRGYQSMDAKTRKELEQIGFVISDQGKHLKLVFHDDSRYTLTLPKSGSDHRGGLNAAGDFSRLLFR
jgi:hypothetical protein